jgi:uncharacterized protein (DUF2249 family)
MMTDPQTLPLVGEHEHVCHCDDDAGVPELDVRVIPHAVRHAAILGALTAIPVGAAMDIVAPHDPKPLLAQIAEREGGAIAVSYLDRGPQDWKLRLTRTR